MPRFQSKLGMTLIEGVFVFVIIAIMIALLFPAIQGATRCGGPEMRLLNNGVNIYKAVFSAAVDAEVTGTPSPWPLATGELAVATSTEYLRWLVTSKILEADCSFFGGRGLPPCTNADPKSFQADNNAWCVVAQTDTNSVPDSTPFLFTRNLDISVSKGKVVMRLTDDPPLGKKWAVIVDHGGAGFVLTGKQLPKYADGLDPAFVKAILRP